MKTFEVKQSKKSKFTRMCMSEAIVSLMKTTPLHKITISSVIKKAGVARMTFYNHYSSIHDALKDYLQIIIEEYLETSKANDAGSFFEYKHILFSLKFFDKYRDYFMTMAKNDMHSVMIDALNQIIQTAAKGITNNLYAMYCYSGGLLNAFLKWEENEKKEDATEIASHIFNFFNTIQTA